MFVLGIDAGGTKTQCMIADETGKILAESFSGPANHQVIGIEKTVESLQKAISEALAQTGLELSDIAYSVFGMAGADEEDDFQILVPAVEKLLGNKRFEVVNDGWIGFRSANQGHAGVVSICGTGAGHAGENFQGERLALRNLDYITGNYGGGNDVAKKAVHYAFRSEEGTWDKSLLEKEIPAVFDKTNMSEVCAILKYNKMTYEQERKIPIIVFELARKGDIVCQKLLTDLGYEEGRYAAAVARRLHMEKDSFPAVLIGSLFKTGEPILLNAYLRGLHEAAPGAYAVIPTEAPVKGAIGLALDYLQMEEKRAAEK